MRSDNSEWRNFCIQIDDMKFISLGQYWDDSTLTWYSSEVALFVDGDAVGEPVKFNYFDGLAEIIKGVEEGDYKVFPRHYLVELDLFDVANDNS